MHLGAIWGGEWVGRGMGVLDGVVIIEEEGAVLQKCNSHFTQNLLYTAQCNEAMLLIVMAMIASLPGARLFGAVWATMASLRGNLA